MKIVFLGAGSTIFAKNVLGDCMLAQGIPQFEIALVDIDNERLKESYDLICVLRDKYRPDTVVNMYDAKDESQTREALKGA